jgi:hypothetical protein
VTFADAEETSNEREPGDSGDAGDLGGGCAVELLQHEVHHEGGGPEDEWECHRNR